MDHKKKLMLGTFGFICIFIIAGLGYKVLSKYYKPEMKIKVYETQEPEAEKTEIIETKNPEEEQTKEPIEEQIDGSETKENLAPDFTVVNKDGEEVKFSDYVGKPIVLNFWASWCPPCKSEMPTFNKVSEEMQGEVIFLMVNMVDGMRETVDIGKAYVEKEGYTFTVLYDNEQMAANTYGITSLPTTVFINKDGQLIAGVEGAIDEETLLEGIRMIQ